MMKQKKITFIGILMFIAIMLLVIGLLVPQGEQAYATSYTNKPVMTVITHGLGGGQEDWINN